MFSPSCSFIYRYSFVSKGGGSNPKKQPGVYVEKRLIYYPAPAAATRLCLRSFIKTMTGGATFLSLYASSLWAK